MSDATSPAPALPKKNKYGWMFYFVFLVVASVGVMVAMIVFNNLLQLKPEELEAAKKRWQEANIKNYNLIYKKKLNYEENWTTFAVKVRNGRVQEVLMNGKPLEREKDEAQDPRPYHSMDAQFRYLTKFMEIDQKPNAPRVYFVADFDSKTGAILKYTRYDSHQHQRVEMQFRLDVVDQ